MLQIHANVRLCRKLSRESSSRQCSSYHCCSIDRICWFVEMYESPEPAKTLTFFKTSLHPLKKVGYLIVNLLVTLSFRCYSLEALALEINLFTKYLLVYNIIYTIF